MKDPVEVRLPGGDFLLVILRVEKSRGWVSPVLFDDLTLDLCHSSALGVVLMGGLECTPLV